MHNRRYFLRALTAGGVGGDRTALHQREELVAEIDEGGARHPPAQLELEQ